MSKKKRALVRVKILSTWPGAMLDGARLTSPECDMA